MLFWLSWIDRIFSIRYHGVTIHHNTHGQHGLSSLCIIHLVAKTRGKREVIHKELSDLFPQLAQTWQTWGSMYIMIKCLVSYYTDVTMSSMASRITSGSIVYLTVGPGPDQRKYQSSASLAFAWGIHRWSVNSSHKRPVTRKIHYTSVTWALWRLESLTTLLIVQQLLLVNK